MTENAFRRLALALPGAIEASHMNHPDFRLHGRIFASLGYPADGWGMAKLTQEQQAKFIGQAPDVLQPCAGAWGRGGATSVRLAGADTELVREMLKIAAGNLPAKGKGKTVAKSEGQPRPRTKFTRRSSSSGR